MAFGLESSIMHLHFVLIKLIFLREKFGVLAYSQDWLVLYSKLATVTDLKKKKASRVRTLAE